MATKEKNFSIRFYSSEYISEDTEHKTLYQLIQSYKPENKIEYITPLIELNDYSYRIKIVNDSPNIDLSISGYFITYRNDLLQKGNLITGNEEDISLNKDEAIIEKTYFILFYQQEKEVFLFQNSRCGKINALNAYLLKLFKTQNKSGGLGLIPIPSNNFDINKILNQKPCYVEYKLAKPRYKYKPDDNTPEWEKSQFIMMENTGAGTFKARLSTKSAAGLNKNKIREIIDILMNSQHTRKCKIKLEDIDQPIDLFSETLKAHFSVSTNPNGTINESYIFQRIRKLKEDYANILEDYL